LKYEFVGELPDWVTLDERKRTVQIEADDETLVGTDVPIEVKVSIGKLKETVSFAIVFKKPSEEP